MKRRRRRTVRETPFSLDSFLDLVTNIVGIIIRLILVAWVGARAYNTLPQILKNKPPTSEVGSDLRQDPLEQELARQRQELATAEARMLEQLRQLDLVKDSQRLTEQQLAAAASGCQDLQRSLIDLEQAKSAKEQAKQQVNLSLADLEKRRARLNQELQDLEKLPPLKKTLHYH